MSQVPTLIGRGARQTPHLMANVEGDPVLVRQGKEAIVKDKAGKTITNSIGMRFVRIPAGKFTMGSPEGEGYNRHERPQHEVEITKAFYMGFFEVTQKQYRTVMGSNPSWFSKDGKGKDKVAGMDTDDFPVEMVRWEDAQAFLRKLSELPEEKKNGRKYRLPTEAEWEYACRGGTSSYQTFHYGNSLSSTQANFSGSAPYGGAAKGPGLGRTCKVGSYKPNAIGLYDMHGNVWEWCSDWYDRDYYGNSPRVDPPGPASGSVRVLRGGAWDSIGSDCRSAWREGRMPGLQYSNFGFRAALVLSE
jgi:formylglycine-generating enzyme required for sulfatase activity